MDIRRAVTIDYTNYRGVRSDRRIIPIGISYGSNEWHTEPQWLLTAVDVDTGEQRVFAIKDIHKWA